MKYVTTEEFSALCGKQTVVELTDGEGGIDLLLLKSVNDSASEEVEGYLRGIYSLPLDTESSIIKGIVVDIMIYRLNQRRNPKNINDSLIKVYKMAVSKLESIQRRTILLEAKGMNNDNVVQKVTSRTPTQKFENHFTGLFNE